MLDGLITSLSSMSADASLSVGSVVSESSTKVSKFAYWSRLSFLSYGCELKFCTESRFVLTNARAIKSATFDAASKPIENIHFVVKCVVLVRDATLDSPNIFPAKLIPVRISSARLRFFITDASMDEIIIAAKKKMKY